MQHLPRALAGLGSYSQFILCQMVYKPDGSSIKLPLDYRTMKAGNPHDPATWLSFTEAAPMIHGDIRLGFAFTKRDPFFFLDLDGCFNPDGTPNEVAQYLIDSLPGAAVERSQSGAGLHIFGTGAAAIPEHGCKNIRNHLELYTADRFVMLTGSDAIGDCMTDCSAFLPFIVDSYFPATDARFEGEWATEPVAEWDGPDIDDVLIAKAMESSSANSTFAGKATFKDLFLCNTGVLAMAYPSSSGDEFDRSSADAALAQHLAFWTGNNHERIQQIMEISALKRDKWEDREGYYLPRTIETAASRQTSFYNANHRAPTTTQPAQHNPMPPTTAQRVDPAATPAPADRAETTTGYQFMSVEEQMTHFVGCVYVRDMHRVFVPDGSFLKSEQFKAQFGGYVFALDSTGTKTTKNAFEVFTESQAIRFPKVQGHAFRPAMASGAIFEDEGKHYVNTYVPVATRRIAGDASRFTGLVEKLLPDERDRMILLSYMAGLLQYPGVKFQYCPVLQGAEGNGKSTLLRIIERGVGLRYTHQPNSSELAKGGGKFTAWNDRKLFIGVEEIHVENKPGGLLDSLKPLITNDRVESQSKGLDQVMADNVANWFMLCNRKDDVPVTTDTRRYTIFYSAQQSKADCDACGMNDAYWRDMYDWLRLNDGYAIINNWLREYQIPDEFNPALISRAPASSSTGEAVMLTKSELEQQLLSAVESDLVGFRGGWISSIKLREYLKENRLEKYCPPNKLRAVLDSIGYDWHPALYTNRGRASTIVAPEGGRPSLYALKGHTVCNIAEAYLATQNYEKAQGYAGSLDSNVFAESSVHPIGQVPPS